MRDSERIPLFLKEIENEWKKIPDWRFGQLMYNFISETGDSFYWEEDEFISKLKEYLRKI